MSQCKIYLENYSGTYYAGSEIRGRVECYFDDETTVRGVKVRLICKERNEWTGTETYRDPLDDKTKTRHITLTGDNDILYNEQMLFGSGSGSSVLGRGKHVYPFSYILPFDIPSTFNGPHGSISYKLKGIVDRPMRPDYEDQFIFVVMVPIDFNNMSQNYQELTTYSDEKTVCCWCCKGGDITMDVELPKSAYVPGETINLKVSVCNLSNSNVDDLKVKFTKTIKYKVTSPHSESKEDVDNIFTITEHGVGAHGEHTYNIPLTIPEYITVPNFKKCNLFNVSYLLQVSCEMPACTLNLDVSIWDIKLGHVQYVGETNRYDERGTITPGFINNLPPIDGAYPPTSPPNPYPGGDNPPPSGGAYPPSYDGNFVSLPTNAYPPQGGAYPPPLPPSGAYNTPGYPPAANNFPSPASGYPEKPVYPGPTAPSSSVANAPLADNPKAREAAGTGPSAPYGPGSELPPPSYSQVQQNTNFSYSP